MASQFANGRSRVAVHFHAGALQPDHGPGVIEHATQTKTFLGSLGPTRKTERARLQADHHRALAVLDAIDTAAHQNEE